MSRVLLPLTASSSATSAIETAIAATRILNGQVDALMIEDEVKMPSAYAAGTGVPAGGWRTAVAGAAAADSMTQSVVDRRERTVEHLREEFYRACAEAGIAVVSTDEEGRPMAAHWEEVAGMPRRLVLDQSERHDLVVSMATTSNGDARELVEAALMRAQRPVILSPARVQKPLTDTVVVAWEESPQCWAAVQAAMPFLAAATAVQAVTIDKDRERPRASQQRLLDHLRERGIEADATVADPLSRPIGQAILSEASDRGAGLLVMGAYSHSPLREFFFGGATRAVLKNAAATPVLMAH